MSQLFKIDADLTPAEIASLQASLSSIHAIIDKMNIPITSIEFEQMIPVSTMRRAEINDIFINLYEKHPEIVSSTFDETEYKDWLKQLPVIEQLIGIFNPILGTLNLAKAVLGNNLFFQSSQLLKSAKVIGKTRSLVSDSADEITKQHKGKHGKRREPSLYSLEGAQSVTISNVTVGKMFVNKSNAVLTINVLNGPVRDTLTVDPQTGVEIPKDWTNVVITNLSAKEKVTFGIHTH